MSRFDEKAAELFLELATPALAETGTCHVAVHGKLAYVCGALPIQDARLFQKGQVGIDVALVDKACIAARQALVTALGMLKLELGGSLNSIKQIVQLTGYVACIPEFRDHDKVFERASTLLNKLFGPAGRHARSVLGVTSLPKGAPVMVDLIVALK